MLFRSLSLPSSTLTFLVLEVAHLNLNKQIFNMPMHLPSTSQPSGCASKTSIPPPASDRPTNFRPSAGYSLRSFLDPFRRNYTTHLPCDGLPPCRCYNLPPKLRSHPRQARRLRDRDVVGPLSVVRLIEYSPARWGRFRALTFGWALRLPGRIGRACK